jgi:glutamate synthase (NADPH/NADH) small chain
VEGAVTVDYLETFVRKNLLDFLQENKRKESKGQKVAIVGSGPSGLTVAEEMWQRGYDVTIFEGKDRIGGILRYGIPDFRLPNAILDELEWRFYRLGIKVRPNTLIGAGITIDHLFRDGYEAIFLGTGVWRPGILNIRGESLPHVHFAIDYLKNPAVYRLGHRVVVIGGGNTAMDTARTLVRNLEVEEVTILYRRSRKEMPARPQEIEAAQVEGVKFMFLAVPVEIGEVWIRCIRLELGEPDEKGRQRPLPVPDSEFDLPADSVLIAIGQRPRSLIVDTTMGIMVNEQGLLLTDKEGRTTREGVFGCGDVVLGGATVIQAVQCGRVTAETMDSYLQRKR